MSLETVDILVESDDVVPIPLDGVTVRVFDALGTTFETEGTTGSPAADGHVEFTLDGSTGGTTYQLRFYKTGVSIAQPLGIVVFSPPALSPTGTNNFSVTASVRTLPVATNPRLCRISGYIKDPSGRPRPGIDIHLIPDFEPLVVDDEAVLGERVNVKTDKDGYVEFDLYQGGIYNATVESMEDIQRCITVPSALSANVSHILFPVAVKVEYTPAAPFAVSVGGTLDIVPVVTASSGLELDGLAQGDVLYESDDPAVFTVAAALDGSKLVLTGVGAGTANLNATRIDTTIIYAPDPGVDGGTAQVTVS